MTLSSREIATAGAAVLLVAGLLCTNARHWTDADVRIPKGLRADGLTVHEYDAQGRLVSETAGTGSTRAASGPQITYEYDRDCVFVQARDRHGNVTYHTYSDSDRRGVGGRR